MQISEIPTLETLSKLAKAMEVLCGPPLLDDCIWCSPEAYEELRLQAHFQINYRRGAMCDMRVFRDESVPPHGYDIGHYDKGGKKVVSKSFRKDESH